MTQPFYAAYINLDRAVERRAFMEGQLAATGIEAIRISAVDRASPDFQPRGGLTVSRDDVLIENNWDGRPYVTGEEACLQSHIKALGDFLATAAQFALIFEDDAELAADFLAVVNAAIANAGLWDAVKLESIRRSGSRAALRIAPLNAPYRLVASLFPASGAAAYLYSRSAAAHLIAVSADAYEPYDNFLSAQWRHKLRVLDVSPFPARQGLAESSRADQRGKAKLTTLQAFGRWRRHVGADFVGRHLQRWIVMIGRFGSRLHAITSARWSRDWPAPPRSLTPPH